MTTRTKCFYGEVGELADVEGGLVVLERNSALSFTNKLYP